MLFACSRFLQRGRLNGSDAQLKPEFRIERERGLEVRDLCLVCMVVVRSIALPELVNELLHPPWNEAALPVRNRSRL